jgi:hypothetical protein
MHTFGGCAICGRYTMLELAICVSYMYLVRIDRTITEAVNVTLPPVELPALDVV